MPTIASNHNYHKSALAQNFFQTATQPVRRFVDNEKRYVFEMVKSWHRVTQKETIERREKRSYPYFYISSAFAFRFFVCDFNCSRCAYCLLLSVCKLHKRKQ